MALAAPARGGDMQGVTGFDEYAEDHPGIAAAVQHHPSLANDAEYLKHHQSLAHFLRTHPLAKTELEGIDDDDTPAPKAKPADDEQAGARQRYLKEHHVRFPPPHNDD